MAKRPVREKKVYDDFSNNDEDTETFHKEIINMMEAKIESMEEEIVKMKLNPIRYGRMIPVLQRQIIRFLKEIGIKKAELKEYERGGFMDDV